MVDTHIPMGANGGHPHSHGVGANGGWINGRHPFSLRRAALRSSPDLFVAGSARLPRGPQAELLCGRRGGRGGGLCWPGGIGEWWTPTFPSGGGEWWMAQCQTPIFFSGWERFAVFLAASEGGGRHVRSGRNCFPAGVSLGEGGGAGVWRFAVERSWGQGLQVGGCGWVVTVASVLGRVFGTGAWSEVKGGLGGLRVLVVGGEVLEVSGTGHRSPAGPRPFR